YHLSYFSCSLHTRDLHSFPTRRSSDLGLEVLIEGASRHARALDDGFDAHCRVAELGSGLACRGHDAFTLVRGDKTTQQPMPPARQLMHAAAEFPCGRAVADIWTRLGA